MQQGECADAEEQRNHGPLSSAAPVDWALPPVGGGGPQPSHAQENVTHLDALLCTWVRSLPILLMAFRLFRLQLSRILLRTVWLVHIHGLWTGGHSVIVLVLLLL